ncbi:MAG: peptidoglycan editing factor PgeF [Deltaproteobacteria bacterium]|nr:MAG: peptidoglycan editing factor PgeF [Deltaproteobacteria bacterium]
MVPLSTAAHAHFEPFLGLPSPVVAGFSRRVDLARSERQPDAETERSWARVLTDLGVDALALMTQVHGDGIVEATVATGPLATVGEADALFTRVPGLAVAVRVADCVPILLAGPGIVAAVHAGWRGVACRLVPKTVARLCAEAGCDPAELNAVVGPAICGRHYEVGAEVVEQLEAAGIPAASFVVPGRGPKPHVDGACAVAWQLAHAGVTHVHAHRRCTWEDPELHSWRRDGRNAGRVAGVIALRPA